jgi:hypothetical protein
LRDIAAGRRRGRKRGAGGKKPRERELGFFIEMCSGS